MTPTSNHNWMPARTYRQTLYIFWLLHQTTTVLITDGTTPTLYIFWLLHQTTTYIVVFPESETLYIFWLLHQTTTDKTLLLEGIWLYIFWLLHQTTTDKTLLLEGIWLYIFWLLHQTTTLCGLAAHGVELYIFWLLHQTTTAACWLPSPARCISFDSYIKPQLCVTETNIPTSCISFDSYIKPQPSSCNKRNKSVVYLLTPTSNHNYREDGHLADELYIFWLLHQTTTCSQTSHSDSCCISFDSYIKPQRIGSLDIIALVVYLLTPTSNHNLGRLRLVGGCVVYLLTPTSNHNLSLVLSQPQVCCISFDSYIKPQLSTGRFFWRRCCISFDSYIKPQLGRRR